MDVHLHNNGTLPYRLNNYQNTRTVQDDLQFLSMEERECILFFEETIGMLEEELEDEGARISAHSHTLAEAHPVPITVRLPSPGDHDIIDLVHPTPEPSKHTDTLPNMPDFQELAVAPETHFEVKAKHNPMENSPPELPIATPVPEEGAHRPPPGSVPTPVVIASNIAEHQGTGGALSLPSMLNQRRRSLELPKNTSAKHGPPTHAKPMHLPDNISLILGSREHIPHSIAAEAVSVQERRAQMLANLPGSAHPLQGGEPVCVRNLPIRSVSFRDLMPDKSRMEALSKLGLVRNRAQSVMYPSPRDSNAEGIIFKTSANTDQMTFKSDNAPIRTCNASSSVHAPNMAKTSNTSSSLNAPNIANTTNKAINNNVTSTANIVADVPTMTHGMDTKDHCQTNTVTKLDNSSPSPALTSAEVTHSDFNSYGGKSITLNPMLTFRAEYIPPQSATAISSPKTEAQEIHLNSFGGWSRVMNPSVAHRDEPQHGYSSYSHSLPNHISYLNNHGAQSKTFSSVKEDYSAVSSHPGRRTTDEDVSTIKVTSSNSEAPFHPVLTRQPPTPAPKPSQRTSPLRPTRPRPSPPSRELRHKPAPKSSFRSQGITVQFSGKGATNEARRDALRKLGLLRDTS